MDVNNKLPPAHVPRSEPGTARILMDTIEKGARSAEGIDPNLIGMLSDELQQKRAQSLTATKSRQKLEVHLVQDPSRKDGSPRIEIEVKSDGAAKLEVAPKKAAGVTPRDTGLDNADPEDGPKGPKRRN